MTEETVETETLKTLADQINKCVEAADVQIVEAAKLIRTARDHFDKDKKGQTTWEHWAREHIKLSESRLRELLRIANADDPQGELDRLRGLNKARQARHRRKNNKKTAPLRNGVESEGISVNLEDERHYLLDWTRSAPIEHVARVLAYAKQLGPDDETPDPDESEDKMEAHSDRQA